MSVEQILNTFQKELESDAVQYLDEARRVTEADSILRDSQRDLLKLTSHTQRCMLQQSQIEETVAGIGAFQDELESTLGRLEVHLDELFAKQAHTAPADADVERERTYKAAMATEQKLQTLQEKLDEACDNLDAAQERVFTTTATDGGGGLGVTASSRDVSSMIQILQQHQRSLADLEAAGVKMEKDIGQIQRALAVPMSNS